MNFREEILTYVAFIRFSYILNNSFNIVVKSKDQLFCSEVLTQAHIMT